MSLIQTVNAPELMVWERPSLVIVANQTITLADRITLLEINWDDTKIQQYNSGGGPLGTVIWKMRWRLNGGAWNVEPIGDVDATVPNEPAFLGLQLKHAYDYPPSYPNGLQPKAGEGYYVELWSIYGTPTTNGVIDIEFSINPNDLNNPFV